jgi:phosphatidylserine/phosphatidylglycerophosphate/cardiolipin synthase-like enzyme
MNYKYLIFFSFLTFIIGFGIGYLIFLENYDGIDKENIYNKLFVCPGCDKEILNLIENSKQRIYCEMYHIDYQKYVDALIDAKKRDVDVKIIVDKESYLCNPSKNRICKYYKNAFEKLKEHGIDIKYNDNFVLMHSKSCLFDNILFVGSHNFTPTSAKKNREINILTNSTKAINEFLNVFNKDFALSKGA